MAYSRLSGAGEDAAVSMYFGASARETGNDFFLTILTLMVPARLIVPFQSTLSDKPTGLTSEGCIGSKETPRGTVWARRQILRYGEGENLQYIYHPSHQIGTGTGKRIFVLHQASFVVSTSIAIERG